MQSNNAQPKQEGQQGKADQRGYSSTAGSALQRRAAKLQAERGVWFAGIAAEIGHNCTCAQNFVPPALNQRIGALALSQELNPKCTATTIANRSYPAALTIGRNFTRHWPCSWPWPLWESNMPRILPPRRTMLLPRPVQEEAAARRRIQVAPRVGVPGAKVPQS